MARMSFISPCPPRVLFRTLNCYVLARELEACGGARGAAATAVTYTVVIVTKRRVCLQLQLYKVRPLRAAARCIQCGAEKAICAV